MQADFFLEQNYSLAREILKHSHQGAHLGWVLLVVTGIIKSGNADQATVKALLNDWCLALPWYQTPCFPDLLFQRLHMESTNGRGTQQTPPGSAASRQLLVLLFCTLEGDHVLSFSGATNSFLSLLWIN